jgi:hypothetical protein
MANVSYYEKVNDFCDRLRQRRVNGSLAAAKGTAELMRQLVTSSKLNDPRNMLTEVRKVGNIIQAAKPIGEFYIFLPWHLSKLIYSRKPRWLFAYFFVSCSLHRACHWQHCTKGDAHHPTRDGRRSRRRRCQHQWTF